MENSKSNIFQNAFQQIIKSNERILQTQLGSQSGKISGKHGTIQKDLQFAFALLLVEIASADSSFDPREYTILSNGMRRLFGTTPKQVQALVNQAKVALKSLRGSSKYAAFLRENLTDEERKLVFETIEEVISADGKLDDFETYLKHKYADLLGIPL